MSLSFVILSQDQLDQLDQLGIQHWLNAKFDDQFYYYNYFKPN